VTFADHSPRFFKGEGQKEEVVLKSRMRVRKRGRSGIVILSVGPRHQEDAGVETKPQSKEGPIEKEAIKRPGPGRWKNF